MLGVQAQHFAAKGQQGGDHAWQMMQTAPNSMRPGPVGMAKIRDDPGLKTVAGGSKDIAAVEGTIRIAAVLEGLIQTEEGQNDILHYVDVLMSLAVDDRAMTSTALTCTCTFCFFLQQFMICR